MLNENTDHIFQTETNINDPSKSNLCWHCGEKLNPSKTVESYEKKFCCPGCSSVYQIIHNLGLEDFYKIKNTQNKNKSTPFQNYSSSDNYKYLNQSEFKKLYISEDSPRTMKFYIEGIHCSACLWLIEKIPEFTPAIESVSLNMSNNIATVTFTGENHFPVFPETIRKFGYKPHPIKSESDAEKLKNKENKKSLYRIGIAAVCTGNIMLLSAAIYSGATGLFAKYFELINFLLSLPVITYCSYPFYKSVYSSLKSGRTTVDIPVAFVVVVGSILSIYNLFNNGEVYFDSITTFIFLLLLSRYILKILQDKVREKEGYKNLLFTNEKVHKWDKNSKQYFLSPINNIKRGDKIKLDRDDRVPVDGKVLNSSAQVNLSVLTGESIPQTALKGDMIFAGSLLEDTAIIKVISTGYSTRIGNILKNIEESILTKNNFSNFSDKYSSIFTILVASLAVTFFILFSSYYNTSEALRRTISFVLISCPCAFVFALPLSFAFSIKSAAEKGFIIKNLSVYEKLKNIKNIFLDKTGTLTKGNFKILDWNLDEVSIEDQAAILAIQKKSNHPVARSIVKYLSQKKLNLPHVEEFKHIYSIGFSGKVNNNIYEFISNENFKSENDFKRIILTKIEIYKNKKLISTILLGDELREDAKYVIDFLTDSGINALIISGDKKHNVEHVAKNLSISPDKAFYELTPEKKIYLIRNNRNSIMIGDGLNDAGALSVADIGISIEGGVEESLKASDVYLLKNNLSTIIDFIKHGNTTTHIVKLSIVFSILYNVIAGIFALLGFINPLVAAVLMPLSSMVLIGISLFGQYKLQMGN